MELTFKTLDSVSMMLYGMKIGTPAPIKTQENLPIIYQSIYADNKCVGLISYNAFKDNEYDKNLYIRGLEIFPEFQKKGFGTKIIKELTNQCLTENIFGKIQCQAENSEKFWTKNGFMKTGKYSEDNDPIMVKYLKKTLINESMAE